MLVEEGNAEPELLSERLRTHEITEFFLDQELMIVDIHVMLDRAKPRCGSGRSPRLFTGSSGR